jgi:hypothetical protein
MGFPGPRKLRIENSERLAYFRDKWRTLLTKWDAFLAELPLPPLNRRPSEIDLSTRQSGDYLEIHGLFYLWPADLLQLVNHAIPPHPKSPMEYVLQVRLNKAKELLLETNRPVGEIARSVGFEDIRYFLTLPQASRRSLRLQPNKYWSSWSNPKST